MIEESRIFSTSTRTVSVYQYIPMCKYTVYDAERVYKINTQTAQLTVAANYLAVTNRLRLREYEASIPRPLYLCLL